MSTAPRSGSDDGTPAAPGPHLPAPRSARAAGDIALREDVDVVLRMGACLAEAGTGAYRVRRAMHRTARAVGIDRLDVAISVTEITLTARRGEDFRTVVREIRSFGVDAARIAALERLSRRLRPGPHVNAARIAAQLDAIRAAHRRWHRWQASLAAGAGCGAFAVLNGFGPADVLSVAAAATAGQCARAFALSRRVNQLGTVAAAAALACLAYVAASRVLGAAVQGWGISQEAGFVAAILFLVPGFPMFTALLDLAHLDFTSGAVRLLYALTVVGVTAGSAWFVASLAGAAPAEPAGREFSDVTFIAVGAAASFAGVGGFALLFNSHARMALAAAVLGAAANAIRLTLLELSVPTQIAAMTGGLAIGLFAAVAARWLHVPRITVSVPAAIIMIPGTAMFRALYHLNTGEISSFLTYATTAALLLVATGAGLALARLLTDASWTFDRQIDLHAYHDFQQASGRLAGPPGPRPDRAGVAGRPAPGDGGQAGTDRGDQR